MARLLLVALLLASSTVAVAEVTLPPGVHLVPGRPEVGGCSTAPGAGDPSTLMLLLSAASLARSAARRLRRRYSTPVTLDGGSSATSAASAASTRAPSRDSNVILTCQAPSAKRG